MIELENRDRIEMTFADHVADAFTAFTGSMPFVWLHLLWFGTWIPLNTPLVGLDFDPFPFSLLTMAVSLEAIFLSTFVLISQNRQAVLADKRAKVDLQVNMISEREVTKLIEMMAQMHAAMGLKGTRDEDVHEMRKPTHVSELADTIDAAEEALQGETAKGPSSAADTEV